VEPWSRDRCYNGDTRPGMRECTLGRHDARPRVDGDDRDGDDAHARVYVSGSSGPTGLFNSAAAAGKKGKVWWEQPEQTLDPRAHSFS